MELSKDRVLPITGKVQHYAWGGDKYLPELLKLTAKKGEKYAEYWLGTHDRGSAEFLNGSAHPVKLKDYIEKFPEQTLGKSVNTEFGRLPFLLKVLDVKDMLSIQVHPTKENAQKEFDAENARGIGLDAPDRNFKDNNHKPELMFALSEFWLLHGFLPPKQLQHILRDIPELHFLVPVFGSSNYKRLYEHVMEMPQQQVDRHLKTLLERIGPYYSTGKLNKNKPDYWAARAALTYPSAKHIDRGIFSIYFLNLVHLHSGEAVFQAAGLPHAYLEGQNVEIMSNSDNVLRGGLTPKHIDVPELLKHVRFEPTIPNILKGVPAGNFNLTFPTPAPDFELGRIQLKVGDSEKITSSAVEIYLVFSGEVEIFENSTYSFKRGQGEAWVCFDGAEFSLMASSDSVIFKASVPRK